MLAKAKGCGWEKCLGDGKERKELGQQGVHHKPQGLSFIASTVRGSMQGSTNVDNKIWVRASGKSNWVYANKQMWKIIPVHCSGRFGKSLTVAVGLILMAINVSFPTNQGSIPTYVLSIFEAHWLLIDLLHYSTRFSRAMGILDVQGHRRLHEPRSC